MYAAHLLAEIIAQRGPVAATAFASNAGFESLIETGFIDELGVAQSVLCDDCHTPHDAELVFENELYGIHCPELGFVPKERSEATVVQPNVQQLVADIARELGCKRFKSTPIHGETWRVGVIPGPVAGVIVYFHPALRDGHDLQALQDALARETRTQFGVVITATGALSVPPFKTLLMEDCLTFNAGTGSFSVDMDLPMFAGVPAKNPGGRPSPYAANLAKIIAESKASAEALPGVNEEARAIQEAYRTRHVDTPAPSTSAIKQAIKRV